MNRSIGFERTIQIQRFEPIKVSVNITDIPMRLWQDSEWIENLHKLLVVNVYKIAYYDSEFRTMLRESSAAEVFEKEEQRLLESLKLPNLNISVAIVEKDV